MTKVPKLNPPPPALPRSAKVEPLPPPVPTRSLPAAVKPQGTQADLFFGNGDGTLDRDELAKYAAAYASQPGFREKVLEPLERALGEKIDAPPVAPAAVSADAKVLALALTSAGGTGSQKDVELVAAEVARVPAPILEKAKAAGLRFVACRDSVTDYCTELKGVKPRGWPPGATWDSVPGVYDPTRRVVVVSTAKSSGGGRHVPGPGEGHSAHNLALHELGHALDYLKAVPDARSSGRTFDAAYDADRKSLEKLKETYLLQSGDAGNEESFAESFARYFGGAATFKKELPHLYAYWRRVEDGLSGGAS